MLLPILATLQPSELPITIGGALCNPRRLIVEARDLPGPALTRLGARIVTRIPQIGYLVVESQPGRLQITKRALAATPGVEGVEFDYASRLAYEPNDTYWPNMWHFRTIGVDKAWDLSLGGPAVVAVIDTGAEVTHPDLAGNIWVNQGEIPGNGIDDDGNGYTDDVNGYDFAYSDPSPNDVFGHGTACSGIVAAVQNNSQGVTGVAPKARIMVLKATNDSGYLYDSYLMPAYVYGADNGARVFSMSFFSDRVSAGERAAMDYAIAKDVLPVAAAGNASSVVPFYPGAYEGVLSVAATDGNNQRAWFSNYGSWVDVAAPGVGVYTTVPGGYTDGFAGTSAACPHVAGVAALMRGAKPSASAQQVRVAIEDTAQLLNQPPFGEFSNYGLVDARAALNALLNSPAPGKAPTVRYVTPITSDLVPPRLELTTARIYGRGFQAPRVLDVRLNGRSLKIMGRARDWIDFRLPPISGTLSIYVDGQKVRDVSVPAERRTVYPMTEANTSDGYLQGGFFEALNPDGQVLTCTRASDGTITVQAVFRRVRPAGSLNLLLRRSYSGGLSGTERVYLYDWSSASYPYGNYIQLGSGSLPGSPTTTELAVGAPGRFIDPEGSVYALIVADNVQSSAQLLLDTLWLVRRD